MSNPGSTPNEKKPSEQVEQPSSVTELKKKKKSNAGPKKGAEPKKPLKPTEHDMLGEVAALKDRQTNHQVNIDQWEQCVQVHTEIIDELKTIQVQQQQKFDELQQQLQIQQEKCDKKHGEAQLRDDKLKQSIDKLETDIKKQQKDRQAAVKDQQSAQSWLEVALKAQDDRTKQEIEKRQKQISDQQQKLETKVADQQTAIITRLETQLQGQQKSWDS